MYNNDIRYCAFLVCGEVMPEVLQQKGKKFIIIFFCIV